MATSVLQHSKPMSVKDIAIKAQAFEFNPHVPLKYWLRTADTLLREVCMLGCFISSDADCENKADIYEGENNDQQAYLLLMRYATLVTEKLSTHPTAHEAANKAALKAAKRNVSEVIIRLEVLKPKLERNYDEWVKKSSNSRPSAPGRYPSNLRASKYASSDPAVAGNNKALAAADHGDLAVKLARSEIRRRDTARRATRQAGISAEEEQQRRTGGAWDDWETAYSQDGQPSEADDMRNRMEETRRRVDGSARSSIEYGQQRGSSTKATRPIVPTKASIQYNYPSIPRSQSPSYESQNSRPSSAYQPPKPPKPPKERHNTVDQSFFDDKPPSIPKKERLDERTESTAVLPPPVTSAPEDVQPQAYTFKPAAYLENGSPLRTVFLPPNLRESFLKCAAPNTRKNLETCGILCGTLIANALFISRLVIPEQESTSDTCETVNEGALFEYCDSEDLMVLGWIHTHPTQTCFMSSRDLHTHCGYQVMMPESIAIVCAPSKDPSWGIFRLTDPPGMKSVLNCRQTGLFHPHAEANIYTTALRPGHVFEAKGLDFEVVDMR